MKKKSATLDPLVIKMRPSRGLNMNASSLIRYFLSLYKEKTGNSAPFDREDNAVVGALLKRRVIDKLVLRGMEVKDMVEFVKWSFENKPPEKWQPRMLGYFIDDWMTARDSAPPVSKEIDCSEEKNFLMFLGEGYFDNELTKYQYWTGLRWRWKNMSQADLESVSLRQKETYTPETTDRLREWETELKSMPDFNPLRQFYFELSANREKSVGETLSDFGRDQYKSLFTDVELQLIPKHASF